MLRLRVWGREERDAIFPSQSHQIPGKFLNALQMAPPTRSSLARKVKLRFVNSALPVTLELSLKDTPQTGSDWPGIQGLVTFLFCPFLEAAEPPARSLWISQPQESPHCWSSWLQLLLLGCFPGWNEFKNMALGSTCNNGGACCQINWTQYWYKINNHLMMWTSSCRYWYHCVSGASFFLSAKINTLPHPSIPQLTNPSPNWQPAVCYCVQQWWN